MAEKRLEVSGFAGKEVKSGNDKAVDQIIAENT